jgi:hypothetical protein
MNATMPHHLSKILCLFALLSLLTATGQASAADARPNIVYVAADHPGLVATLQNRANELAAQSDPSLFLQGEFKGFMGRLHLPPALLGEDDNFDNDDFNAAAHCLVQRL